MSFEDTVNEEGRVARFILLARSLWNGRKIVVAVTLAAAVMGAVYSLLAPKVFVSRAVVYPKEISATSDKSLVGLSAGLNPLTGISHLNRVDVVAQSPELAAAVLRREGILPALFPGWWDAASKRWKQGAPTELDGQEALRKALYTKVDSYRLTLEIRVSAGDAGTAYRILKAYLEALNERLKETVVRDADANRQYLESQLSKTYDPWIREKIQDLILRQVETGMMLNANAFEVLEGPVYPRLRESPVRKRIVLVWTAAGFALACAGVLVANASRGGAVRKA